ncbi:hypothetical protein CIB95_11675 [Lottiidibacillus patelloidae]|uniref:Uncharacterized protein n=1 Tax=Lottiidibacillus patelloidae TaxID=2670334 RepID=A0A263BST3_9BACI|nr:hypothetical protein [Lottiidibacillus patelloidae]OZM56427.1 hypothetical protein CIB95_11675 [Lottiidibacillus patelloidae]
MALKKMRKIKLALDLVTHLRKLEGVLKHWCMHWQLIKQTLQLLLCKKERKQKTKERSTTPKLNLPSLRSKLSALSQDGCKFR